MRLLLAALLPALLLPAADTLSQGERDRAMSHLHATRKLLTDSATGLSAKQLAFQPGAGQWSIGDIVEHLAETESFLFNILTKQVMAAPAAPEKKALVQGKDDAILKVVAAREQKVKAPEPLVPNKKFATTAAALAAFNQRRLGTVKYVEDTKDDLRSHFMNGPDGNPMDGYQVILLISAHTERHVNQIREIKAAAGFPKK